MNKKLILSVIVIFIFLVIFSACGNDTSLNTPQPIEQTKDLDEEEKDISSNEIPNAIEGKSIENFPLYDDAILIYCMQTENAISNVYAVLATIDDVFNFYQTELSENGWETSLSMKSEDGDILYANNSSISLMVVISEDSDYDGYVDLAVTIVQ